jgi:hypothetical protein
LATKAIYGGVNSEMMVLTQSQALTAYKPIANVKIDQKIVSTNNWWTLWTTSQGLIPNNTRHGVSIALSLSIA